MTPADQKSLLTIALFAAFSDGHKAETEREEIRRIAASLAPTAQGVDMAALYQDVLLKRTSVAEAAHALQDADYRQLAYEMAVCVCDADGQQTAPEQQFLAMLKVQLQLDDAQTQVFDAQAQSLAVALPIAVTAPAAAPSSPLPSMPSITATPVSADHAALDKSILNYAILNGALELLPQSWASMAIIPLQVKMVYAIGKSHGVELDRGWSVVAVPGAVWPQIAGRVAGENSGAHDRLFGQPCHRHGVLFCHHVRAGPGGQTLLQRGPGDEHRAAAQHLSRPDGPGQTAPKPVPAAHSAKGQHLESG